MTATTSSTPMSIRWDHSDLSHVEAAQDSPALRASISNLSRRTTAIKRACKAVLKTSGSVKSHLLSLEASQATLDESLHALHALCQGLDHVAQRTANEERARQKAARRRELNVLEENVEQPLQELIGKCRAAAEAQRSFEGISKAYYSATQRWLATPATSQDGGAADGEESDETQRQRELVFALARLQLMETLASLHGGEAEVQVAASYLAGFTGAGAGASSSSTTSLESTLQEQRHRIDSERTQRQSQARALEAEIEACEIALHGVALDKSINPTGGSGSGSIHTASSMSGGSPIKISGGGPGGGRLRNILNTLSTNHDGGGGNDGGTSPSSPFKGLRQRLLQHGGRKGAKPAGPSASFDLVPVPGTPSAISHETPPSSPPPAAASPSSPSSTRTRFSPSAGGAPRRSVSLSGNVNRNALSARRTAMDGPRNGLASPSLSPSTESPHRARPTSLIPSIASSPSQAPISRKREGVLWVHSKPLSLSGSATSPLPNVLDAHRSSSHWHEAWVVLSGSGHLGEYAGWREANMVPSSRLIDLRFATVRSTSASRATSATTSTSEGTAARKWTFEIVTRDGTRRLYQATSEGEMKEWMQAIGKAIESLIDGTSSVRQVDKVARREERNSGNGGGGGAGTLGEWGAGLGMGMTSSSSSPSNLGALGQHRAFTQSLTDLSDSGLAARRLFHPRERSEQQQRAGAYSPPPPPASGSKSPLLSSFGGFGLDRSTKHLSLGGHLATLSEVAGRNGSEGEDRGGDDAAGGGARGQRRHTQDGSALESSSTGAGYLNFSAGLGISNETPVSGYIGAAGQRHDDGNLDLDEDDEDEDEEDTTRKGRRASELTDADLDFDRRIEEMVHRSYGSSTGVTSTTNKEYATAIERAPSPALSSVSSSSSRATFPGPSTTATADSTTTSTTAADRAALSTRIDLISRQPSNSHCFDCHTPSPRWASIALHQQPCCIFLCITCSGMHRSLGVAVSRVKSVDLDEWSEEQVRVAEDGDVGGNERARVVWEAGMGEEQEGRRGEGGREWWVRKYVRGEWRV